MRRDILLVLVSSIVLAVSIRGHVEARKTGDAATFTLPGGATMEMVWIEPGTFVMGSPPSEPGHRGDEFPHEVTITHGFWLGKYELTQAQWASVMGTRPWVNQCDPSMAGDVPDNPDLPAVCISRYDIQGFIGELNEAEGAEVYRVPTEAEWEYACRAGTTTMWSFGSFSAEWDRGRWVLEPGSKDVIGTYVWYHDNSWLVGVKHAHPVGTKLPNPWGLYDMHGNVFEDVQDWYQTHYPRDPQSDPTGPASGSYHVMRGGGFGAPDVQTRSALRYGKRPLDLREQDVGVRLVKMGSGDVVVSPSYLGPDQEPVGVGELPEQVHREGQAWESPNGPVRNVFSDLVRTCGRFSHSCVLRSEQSAIRNLKSEI